MRYLVHITNKCREMAKTHNVLSDIEKLSEKVESDQSISSWECFLPDPVIRKGLGRSFRLIAVQKIVDDNIIIIFIGVWARSSSDYEKSFMNNPPDFVSKYMPTDEELMGQLKKRLRKKQTLPEIIAPNDIEYGYLYDNTSGLDDEDNEYGMIFESHDWVKMIRNTKYQERISRYYDLLNDKITHSKNEIATVVHEQSGAKILYKRFPAIKCILLIAPLLNEDQVTEELLKNNYSGILNTLEDQISIEELAKYSSRSYPQLVLADEEQTWYEIEKNTEGNLALSPEEAAILKVITQPEDVEERYPLFINGRPGSGKSTILQYLFAEHLFLHLSKEKDSRLDCPPIYLTYSEQLLNAAKIAVNTLLKCNSKFITNNKIDLESPEVIEVVNRSFGEFHRYILKFIPKELRENKFRPEKYLQYSTFRREWNKYKKNDPDVNIRKMSPEVAWHVIRTFIKGMSDQGSEFLSLEAYEELSKEQQTVSNSVYELIYERVWEKWYKPMCDSNSYWDNQDLTAEVLSSLNKEEFAKYPAIVCDEAQDFTRNELELILNLSVFSKRTMNIAELARVPFAFAGDPYQTLNPTGFNWNVVRSGFHEKIVKHLDRTSSGRLKMNYKELSYNYRSSKHIVGFTNLIQLLRGLLFDINNLKPQKTWFDEGHHKNSTFGSDNLNDSRLPQYYDVDSEACKNMLVERAEIIIILPCQEGEEEEYVREDSLLSSLAKDNYYARNFLSPMQAKGLEFNTVVLYKFGEDMAENYSDLFEPLTTKVPHKGEESLPLEYFTNRLYVAASRAKKNLMLIDTKRGIEFAWKNHAIIGFDELVIGYNLRTDVVWSIEDLTLVEPGIDAGLDSSVNEDNPFDIAESFRFSGMSEENPYLLRMAANNYRRINQELDAKKCEAYAYVFEEKYKDAGLLFASISMKKEALEYLWCSGSLDSIAENNLLVSTIYHKTAIFLMESQKTPPDFTACHNLIDNISKSYAAEPLLFKGVFAKQWGKVLESILSNIISVDVASKGGIASSEWEIVYENIYSLFNVGLLLFNAGHFAELAFLAGYYSKAIDDWEKGHLTSHKNYFIAKSKMSNYPESVTWLYKGGAFEEAAKVIKDNIKDVGVFELPEEALGKIADYFIQDRLFEEAFAFLKYNPIYNKISELHIATQISQDKAIRKNALELLIKQSIAGGKWEDIINYYEKQEFDDSLIDYANELLIVGLAESDEFVNASNKRKEKIGKYLKKLLIDSEWKGLVDIRVAGAAIENANKVIDALDFYELIWSKRKIRVPAKDIIYSRERWLKRKYILAELTKSPKHLKEADELNEDWGLNIEIDSLPKYPGFKQTQKANSMDIKQQVALSTKQQKAVLACQKQKMNIKDIAEVLGVKPEVIKEFLKKYNETDNYVN